MIERRLRGVLAKKLRSDRKEIFRAAADAQRIAYYLLAFHPDYATSKAGPPDSMPSAGDGDAASTPEPMRVDDRANAVATQGAELVVGGCADYATHSLRRTKAYIIYKQAGWAYLIPLSLLFKRFDVVWNGNPALGALHPDEEFWPEPASVIKRAGFDGSHVGCRFQNVIDADPTFWTEHTHNLVATVSYARELLRLTSDCQAVFLDRHGHAEGACGLALAFFAVAREDADWFHRYDVTH